MNNNYKLLGNEKVTKPKGLKIAGVLFGVIGLIALIVGIALAIVYPMMDSNAYSVVDGLLYGLTQSDGLDIVFTICMALAIVLAVVYAFASCIQMLSSTKKDNGNREIIFNTGLIIVFFWLMNEFAYETNKLGSLGFIAFQYTTIAVLCLSILYKLIDVISFGKGNAKGKKKFSICYILAILACLIAIVGGVIDTQTFGISFARYTETEVSFATELTELIKAISSGSGEVSVVIVSIVILLGNLNIIAGIFVVAVALIFNLFKLGKDIDSVRKSRYFSRSSALFTAGNFAFTLFLVSVLEKVIKPVLAGKTFADALAYFDPITVGIFVVVLGLCIACEVLILLDKKKVKKQELDELVKGGDEVFFNEEETATSEPVVEEKKEEPVVVPEKETKVQEEVPEGYVKYQVQPNQGGGTTVIYIGQPMQAQQPVQTVVQPDNTIVQQKELESEIEEEIVDGPLLIERKTFDEKLAELSAKNKKYYRDIMKYAESKDGVKRSKTTFADSVIYGRDCIVKVQIKQGKLVCNYSLLDYKVKSTLKGVKEQTTVVKIVDDASFETAKNGIDVAYQLALDAKEEKHQEQLRKRREARAAEKAKEQASAPAPKKASAKKEETVKETTPAKKPATKKPTIVVKKSDEVLKAEEQRKKEATKKPTPATKTAAPKKTATTAKKTDASTKTTAKKTTTTAKKTTAKK